MPSRKWFYRIMAMICTCSCSPVHREQPATIKPITHDPVGIPPIDGWLPHQTATAGQYVIEDSSTVSVNSDSAQVSSINRKIAFTLTTQLIGNSTVLLARVDSFLVSSHTPTTGTTPDGGQLQMFETTLFSTGKVQKIDARPNTICVGGQDPVASRILDLTITYPKRKIKDGDKWADTTRITTCRGEVPLRQESTRQYEMLGRIISLTPAAVKIQRTTSTRFIGTGTSARNKIDVNGFGTSSTTFWVNEVNGSVLNSNGKSALTLNVSTVRGSYIFLQNIITNIKHR